MDKLRLFTPRNAVPIPITIRKGVFECTGTAVLGNSGLKNYYYIDHATGVHLTDGPNGLSLEVNPTKYLHGHNYQQIDRNELAEFAQLIEDRYQTEFTDWKVSAFDYNSDIEVEHNPARYFTEMGKLAKWRVRETDGTGIGYQTASNTKAFTLYDLHLRCKQDDTPISEDREGENRIRLEASFNSKLPSVKELRHMQTFRDYLQPDNYRSLPELWLKTYEMIEKNEPVEYIPHLTRAERDMLTAIRTYTLNGYRDRLKIDYPNGGHYYHFKKVEQLMEKVRAHRRTNTITQVEELNQKVRQRAQELIQAI